MPDGGHFWEVKFAVFKRDRNFTHEWSCARVNSRWGTPKNLSFISDDKVFSQTWPLISILGKTFTSNDIFCYFSYSLGCFLLSP